MREHRWPNDWCTIICRSTPGAVSTNCISSLQWLRRPIRPTAAAARAANSRRSGQVRRTPAADRPIIGSTISSRHDDRGELGEDCQIDRQNDLFLNFSVVEHSSARFKSSNLNCCTQQRRNGVRSVVRISRFQLPWMYIYKSLIEIFIKQIEKVRKKEIMSEKWMVLCGILLKMLCLRDHDDNILQNTRTNIENLHVLACGHIFTVQNMLF